MIGALARARHRRGGSQAGYTLLEVVIGVAISAMILVPLTAWAILVMRQQPIQRDGMLRTAHSGLLGSVFPSDVSVAGQASVDMSPQWAINDCAGGTSAGGSRQLVMVSAGVTVEKVIYSVAPSARETGQSSIWRRTCGLGSDDTVRSEQELFRGVEPGSTSITCSSSVGDAPCRQIALSTTPLGTTQRIEISATRRVNSEHDTVDSVGDPLPVAVIDLVSMEPRTQTVPMSATFSAARSTVGSGHTITYEWEFESDVTAADLTSQEASAQFPPLAPGQENRDFTVRLTVTDGLGRTNTTFLRISSSNMDPVAVISRISPDPVEVGETVTFNALPIDGQRGSYDPDGSIQGFEWLIMLPESDPEAPSREVWLSGPTASYTTKAGDEGMASVRLVVTDMQLARSSVSGSFEILDPTTPTTTTTTTVPPGGDQVIAAFTAEIGPTSLVRHFDASTSIGVDAGTTYVWSFGDGSVGSGMNATHTYGSAGTYPVSLTVTTSEARSATANRNVVVSLGPLVAPDPRASADGKSVIWAAIPGADNYLVNFRFSTPTDCNIDRSRQLVGNSASPSKSILQNPCTNRNAKTEVQVGVVSSGREAWSGWIVVPTNNLPVVVSPPTTQPPVVK